MFEEMFALFKESNEKYSIFKVFFAPSGKLAVLLTGDIELLHIEELIGVGTFITAFPITDYYYIEKAVKDKFPEAEITFVQNIYSDLI